MCACARARACVCACMCVWRGGGGCVEGALCVCECMCVYLCVCVCVVFFFVVVRFSFVRARVCARVRVCEALLRVPICRCLDNPIYIHMRSIYWSLRLLCLACRCVCVFLWRLCWYANASAYLDVIFCTP